MEVVELQGRGGSLRLTTDANGWCSVLLRTDRDMPLGGDLLRIVKGKLIKILQNCGSLQPTASIHGVPVIWVLGLQDLETSIYAARIEEKLRFYFQDRDAHIINQFDLTPADIIAWSEVLEKRN